MKYSQLTSVKVIQEVTYWRHMHVGLQIIDYYYIQFCSTDLFFWRLGQVRRGPK